MIPKNAKRAYKGDIYEVYTWPQKLYDGSVQMFEGIRQPDNVQVIPVFKGIFI